MGWVFFSLLTLPFAFQGRSMLRVSSLSFRGSLVHLGHRNNFIMVGLFFGLFFFYTVI